MNGKSATAATCPNTPWRSSTQPAILDPSPPSKAATRHRESSSKAHHTAGLCPDLWEPYDGRLSRTVLREPEGETLRLLTKHPKVLKAWLAANPRIHVHFTPTSGPCLNLVEVWFGIVERQAIHRCTFASARDLMTKIRVFINGWNDPAALRLDQDRR